MFTQDNTDGYTGDQLQCFNDLWELYRADRYLVPGTDRYNQEQKHFADLVTNDNPETYNALMSKSH